MTDFNDKLTRFLDHFMVLADQNEGEESEHSFNKEFLSLKLESQQYKEQNLFPAEAGTLPINKKKNRFKDILPYEYTRVQLHKTEGIEGSDYINANYIQGADGNVTYIAAQGPLPHTVDDFWRMLWYHQIEIVIMACREVEMGKQKCQSYWPSSGESAFFGAIKVTTEHEENFSNDFIIRQLKAECQGEEQVIRQFHYMAWPDHGRPTSATPIIRMIEMFREHRKRHDIPFVVHCSAGCGRTGTIIAIDYARTLLLSKSIPDEFSVYAIVQKMRKQRPAMVQALDQYFFVYMAIVELVQRTLSNVPQPPPKTLKFEKETNEESPPISTSNLEAIYENVHKSEGGEQEESEQKGSPSPDNPPRPIPLARSSSGGGDSRPLPPPKPVKPRPEAPKKPPEAPPRKLSKETKVEEPTKVQVPVPAPRKHSPLPPPSSEGLYSIPTPAPRDTSTPSKPATKTSSTSICSASDNSSSRSILETLIDEVGDVLAPEDFKEVTGHSPTAGQLSDDYTYALVGAKPKDEVPPVVPAQTVASTQMLSPDVGIYELANQSGPVLPSRPSPQSAPPTMIRPISPTEMTSSSTALTIATMKPGQELKKGLKPKPKDKLRFNDDTNISPARGGHAPVARINSSPTKKPSVGERANDKYTFPGDLGYGVRVGKPRGPRPVPANWNMLNGIIH